MQTPHNVCNDRSQGLGSGALRHADTVQAACAKQLVFVHAVSKCLNQPDPLRCSRSMQTEPMSASV